MKITVGGEHQQLMPNAKLRKQRVDRANLKAGAATGVAQLCSSDMVASVRNQQRQDCKLFDNLLTRFRSGKALQ